MAYFAHAHQDGCFHSEVFFDPQGHVERGIRIETVIDGFDRACKDAAVKFGTSSKLIMCILRHLPASAGLEIIEAASQYFEKGTIHGMGLDSAEKHFPPEIFENCYRTVKSRFPNVNLTAHAGEEGDYTYVAKSLDVLKVTRIDHGVNANQNAELMAHLALSQTMLSMCPLSNVKLQVVHDVADLPIKTFFDNNIPFSINSDDPAYFGGYILDNYVAVHTRFGFTRDQWCQIVLNGIDGSWCDENRKTELRKNLESVRSKYASYK